MDTVLFDAVGTLIRPSPTVSEAYRDIGSRYDAEIAASDFSTRFQNAFRHHFSDQPNRYSQRVSDAEDRRRWQRLVQDVFQGSYSNSLFKALWDHFAEPGSWECYPDVIETLSELQQRGFLVGIASNFDSRLPPILGHHLPMIPPEMVFYSTGLGFAKPDVRFFKALEQELDDRSNRHRLLMIGDNWQNDVEAAWRAGWRAIWKSSDWLPAVSSVSGYFFRST
ncbi:MAG: HAD-IA family hydrolase [Planctomycetota bacterium]|nr:HAD-IA family hydrolase [Planctomycetota bacterium]